MLSNSAKFSAVAVLAAAITMSSGCGGDDSADAMKCPAGTVAGTELECSCGDAGGMGKQVCQVDMTLTACNCVPGGSAGTNAAGTGAGTGAEAGKGGAGTSATAGSGSKDDEDSGVPDMPAADGGTKDPVTPATKAPMDGKQSSACNADIKCVDGLECYNANGSTTVGYCTTTCETDDDCTTLGDDFACSTAAFLGATRFCRQSCTGETDKSCPKFMACTAVTGGTFRCLYDSKDIGTGKGKVFEKCMGSGDCSGKLVCYASGVLLGNIGGMSYSGYCTQPCEDDNDCTENPKTGDVAPSCDADGSCGLGCSALLGLGDNPCPDDMQCVTAGLLQDHCLYTDSATGGI